VTSLLLPILEPRRTQQASPILRIVPYVTASPAVSVTPLKASFAWEQALLFVLAAGVLVRIALLGVGLCQLRGLRRRGRTIRIDGVVGVEVREVRGLRGPAAFGWLSPVILLPAGMPDGPVRDAALRHELQHVLRRDWLENMIERAAASILWFHPMIWWLLERIHLTREQAVDAEVAGAGRERDQYLQSLLTSAGLANLASLPASSFVRRPRHLVERVAFLSKEMNMSFRRTLTSAALVTLISGVALTLVINYLPLQLSAQGVNDSPFHWMRFSPNAEGAVQLEATLNSAGEVVDARVVSGPDELRRTALQSVLAWRYKEDLSARRIVPITIDFKRVPGGTLKQPPSIEGAAFEGVDYDGLPTDLQQRAAGVMALLRTGQKLTQAELDDLRRNLIAIDPSIRLGYSIREEATGSSTVRLGVRAGTAGLSESIRVGGNVQSANLISRVDPVYPPEARQARIQGTVRFTVMVGKDGSVQQIQLVSGHPLFVAPAQDAVRQFKYKPTFLNGEAVTVQTTVDVNFTL
jgi:TonB family protein